MYSITEDNQFKQSKNILIYLWRPQIFAVILLEKLYSIYAAWPSFQNIALA
jgi:hypothetical protein